MHISPPPPHGPLPTPPPRRDRRKPIIIGVAVFLTLGAIGGIIDAAGGNDDTPTAHASTSPQPTTPAATRAATPEQKFRDAVRKELGRSNRKIKRVDEVTLHNGYLTVKWAINEQLTKGLTRKGARRDIIGIIKAIQKAKVPVERAQLFGTYALKDAYGNASEDTVVRVLYTGETIARINPEGVDRDRITDLAEPGAFIAPAFRM